MSGSTSFDRFLSRSGRKSSEPSSPDVSTAALEALTEDHTVPASQHLPADDSPAPRGADSAQNSGEWHLSSIEEMVSLNWGDGSRDGEDLTGDVERKEETGPVEVRDDTAAPRPPHSETSPPRHRLSSSTLPPPRVQFSPLSLCPSPLLGAPPPRTPHDSPTTRHLPRSVRAILKAPGTPGTGRSVRFSASIREQSIPHFADLSRDSDHYTNVESGVYKDVDDVEDDVSIASTDASHAVASFLSKLQAVIPSPEVSHAESSILLPLSNQPQVTVSSPVDTSKSFKIDRVYLSAGSLLTGTDENLFDTSAPQFSTGGDWSIANDDRSTRTLVAQNPFLSASARLSDPSLHSSTLPLPHIGMASLIVTTASASPAPATPPPSFAPSEPLSPILSGDETNDAGSDEEHTYDASRTEASVYGTPRAYSARETSMSVYYDQSNDGIDVSHRLEQSQYFNSDEGVDPSVEEIPATRILVQSTIGQDLSMYEQSQYHEVADLSSPQDSHPTSPSSPPSPSNLLITSGIDVSSSTSDPLSDPCPPHDSDPSTFVASLLSIQGNLLANSSSQQTLLSSVVASLQTDVDRKDAFIARLAQRNAQVEADLERALDGANSSSRVASEVSIDQASLAAVHQFVQQLTAQMELDSAKSLKERSLWEAEVSSMRSDVREVRNSVRDSEIRLHHAQVSQVEAEVARSLAEEEVERQRALYAELSLHAKDAEDDHDDTRLRLHRELADLENTIVKLREELSTSQVSLADTEDDRDAVILAAEQDRAEARRISAGQEQAIEHLTRQATTTQEQNDHLREQVLELERSLIDERVELERMQSWRREEVAKGDELDATRMQITTLERALEEQSNAIQTRDNLLHAQSTELEELNDALRRSRVQRDHQETEDIEALRSAIDQLAVVERENVTLLEQTQAFGGKLRSLEEECNRMKELVRTLRRESADREVKLVRLHRIKSELTEDCLGLNIALDAKQQEVQLWKRQASTRGSLNVSTGISESVLRPPSHLYAFETPSRPTRRVKPGSRRPAPATSLKENERPRQDLVPVLLR